MATLRELLKDKHSQIPSLQDLCINVIQSNLNKNNCLVGFTDENVNKILQNCSPEELSKIQRLNKEYYGLTLKTEDLWKSLCHRDFKLSKQLQDYQKDSWEKLYFERKKEREEKMKNISKGLLENKQKNLKEEKAKETKVLLNTKGGIKTKTTITKIAPPKNSQTSEKPLIITREISKEKKEEKSKPLFKEKVQKDKKPKLIYAQKTEHPKQQEVYKVEKRKIDLSNHETPRNIINEPDSPIELDDSPLIETEFSKRIMRDVRKNQQLLKIPTEKVPKKKEEPLKKIITPDPYEIKNNYPKIQKKKLEEKKEVKTPAEKREGEILDTIRIPKKTKI